MDLSEIKSSIRKRFKSLVNLGERLWTVNVCDSISDEEFREFRELHYKVAGRRTRSIETWNMQKKAIDNKEAFLITLRNDYSDLVGAGLFYISRDEGVYAVGAYNRDLFDKPVSHVVQMRAIQHMKEIGLRWYRIGTRFYQTDDRTTTDKEYNIAYFKEGFSTNMFLNIITKLHIDKC